MGTGDKASNKAEDVKGNCFHRNQNASIFVNLLARDVRR